MNSKRSLSSSTIMKFMTNLAKQFGEIAVGFDGRTPLKTTRQEAIDAFQCNPNARIFLGSIQAAGTGITLTSAKIAIFAELSFVPAILSQCEDRLHRIGQRQRINPILSFGSKPGPEDFRVNRKETRYRR